MSTKTSKPHTVGSHPFLRARSFRVSAKMRRFSRNWPTICSTLVFTISTAWEAM